MNFPFTMDSVVNDVVGRRMVISSNVIPHHRYEPEITVVLAEDGSTDVGYVWEIAGGKLSLSNPSGVTVFQFNGLDIENNVVRMNGVDLLKGAKQGHLRVTMHQRKPLNETKWGIRISSHVDYAEDAVPHLLRSIGRSKSIGMQKFDADRIIVVVGGAKEASECVDHGVRFVKTPCNKHGFVSLAVKDNLDLDYWLLLHDTCDVSNGFMSLVGNIDVGLNPDMVEFDIPGWPTEARLYSGDFVSKTVVPDIQIPRIMASITNDITVSSKVRAVSRNSGERDVYGTGTKRSIIEVPSLGMMKYAGKMATGGKP